MLEALHQAGHKYLKLLFVTALAGSSALFFIGSAVPQPPALVVIIIGGVLGVALEWAYYTVSCDLTESITEGHKGGVALNLFYTLIGGIASWFLFTNAALHVRWAPTDDLLGLQRTTWAMIMGAMIVVVVFVLSARRKRPQNATDLQAMARAVTILLPGAPDAVRLRLLSTMAGEAAKYNEGLAQPRGLPAARVVEEASPKPATAEQALLPARPGRSQLASISSVKRPGLLKRAWQWAWSSDARTQEDAGDNEEDAQIEENTDGEQEEERGVNEEADEQDVTTHHREAEAATLPPAPRYVESADHLQRTLEALTANPNISDEALAEVLGLKRPGSARYWRLRAQEVLTGHQPKPTSAHLSDEQRPRSRQEILGELGAFAQALKADTCLDLEALLQQVLAKSKEPLADEAGTQAVSEYPPFPAVRTGQPGTNHGNHGDGRGSYERWGAGGEGGNDDASFRHPPA